MTPPSMASMIDVERVTAATPEVGTLVAALEDDLAANYPPEQRHGLSLDAIFQPHIRFFLARRDGAAVGCGGVALFDGFAELKRMFVLPAARGSGVVQALLRRLEAEAGGAGLRWLRLETGDRQLPAIRVYERAGFHRCGSFGAYASMPPGAVAASVFMEKPLGEP